MSLDYNSIRESIFEEIASSTKKSYIKIKYEVTNDNIFISKVGGTPYIPKDCLVPENSTFICQFLLEDLPQSYVNLPNTGILQLFVNEELEQDDHVLIYHPIVDNTVTLAECKVKCENMDNSNSPVTEGIGKMIFSVEEDSVSTYDIDFQTAYVNMFNEKLANGEFPSDLNLVPISSWYEDANDEECDGLAYASDDYNFKHFKYGSKIGGYPTFDQEDVREPNSGQELLFQIGSDVIRSDNGNFSVMWGDSGTGKVFMTKQALDNRDWKDSSFFWDCV